MTDLWSSLLRESSKRSNYPEGTVLFLGDSYCGKTKLVEQLCTHDSKDIHSQSEYVAKEILSYNFFEIDESFSNSDISSKIGIWSIGDKCFDHAIEMVINAVKQNKILIAIGIDLSLSEEKCSQSIEKWLKKIISIFNKESVKSTIKSESVKSYLQNLKLSKFSSSSSETTQSFNDAGYISSIRIDLGFPIIIIGCKSDTLTSADELVSVNQAKLTQGYLRTISLSFGAALVYTSAEKKTNLMLLKHYIYHRMFSDAVFMNLSIENSLETTFVPTGFDRTEIISISSGFKDIERILNIDWNSPLSIPSGESNTSITQNQTQFVLVEMESEDEWLAGLQNQIKQALDQNPVGTSVSASSSSSNLAGTETTAGSTGGGKSRRNSGVLDPPIVGDITSNNTSTTSTAPVGVAGTRPKRTPPVTSATSGQDVNSFFQNLLSSSNPKK